MRKYCDNSREYYLYRDMRANQSLEFAIEKRDAYKKLDKGTMTVKKALSMLDEFIDPSDPDLDVPNSIHAYQTAERIRRAYPEDKEFQIVGLIHDLGKVLFSYGEPPWAVVGDTYIMGCEFPKSIVYYDTLMSSPDIHKYPGCGIYEKGCGLNSLTVSFGHDEYFYWVLYGNRDKHRISKKYMDVIRYHSLYPWHTGGDYHEFMNGDEDQETLKHILDFNKFDLYSKEDAVDISDDVKAYYDNLLDQYFDGELLW